MRTFLLASMGLVGLAGAAAAATPSASTQASLPTGVMGVPAAPTTFLGGNNILNQDGSALANGEINKTHAVEVQVPTSPHAVGAASHSRGSSK